MSVESLALVLHHSRARGTAKLVAIGIANHDGDGGAWPSIATLARYANVTHRNAQAAVRKLVESGELEVLEHGGGLAGEVDAHRPNLYRLRLACPQWCDRTAQHRDTRHRRPPGTPLEGVGSDGRVVSLSTPSPLSLATPKPSLEPRPPQVVPQVQDTRARWEASCDVCSQLERLCRARDAKLPLEERHAFTPRARG